MEVPWLRSPVTAPGDPTCMLLAAEAVCGAPEKPLALPWPAGPREGLQPSWAPAPTPAPWPAGGSAGRWEEREAEGRDVSGRAIFNRGYPGLNPSSSLPHHAALQWNPQPCLHLGAHPNCKVPSGGPCLPSCSLGVLSCGRKHGAVLCREDSLAGCWPAQLVPRWVKRCHCRK